MHMLRSGTKVCTCRGQGQRYAHTEVRNKGVHMLRLPRSGTGMHMLRSETKVCTC